MLTCLLTLVLLAGASTARGQVSAQGVSDPNMAFRERLQAERQEYNFTKSGFHFPVSTNQPDYW